MTKENIKNPELTTAKTGSKFDSEKLKKFGSEFGEGIGDTFRSIKNGGAKIIDNIIPDSVLIGYRKRKNEKGLVTGVDVEGKLPNPTAVKILNSFPNYNTSAPSGDELYYFMSNNKNVKLDNILSVFTKDIKSDGLALLYINTIESIYDKIKNENLNFSDFISNKKELLNQIDKIKKLINEGLRNKRHKIKIDEILEDINNKNIEKAKLNTITNTFKSPKLRQAAAVFAILTFAALSLGKMKSSKKLNHNSNKIEYTIEPGDGFISISKKLREKYGNDNITPLNIAKRNKMSYESTIKTGQTLIIYKE